MIASHRLAIIIPAKCVDQGKSRLSSALDPACRASLCLSLLERTFEVARQMKDEATIYVVSRSPAVLERARRSGFAACEEGVEPGLNHALARARDVALLAGHQDIMVLPTDLAYVSAERLRRWVRVWRGRYDVLAITDRARDGTNLLLWRNAATASFMYGPGSAKRHVMHAASVRLKARIVQDADLSLDIDQPHDLDLISITSDFLPPRPDRLKRRSSSV